MSLQLLCVTLTLLAWASVTQAMRTSFNHTSDGCYKTLPYTNSNTFMFSDHLGNLLWKTAPRTHESCKPFTHLMFKSLSQRLHSKHKLQQRGTALTVTKTPCSDPLTLTPPYRGPSYTHLISTESHVSNPIWCRPAFPSEDAHKTGNTSTREGCVTYAALPVLTDGGTPTCWPRQANKTILLYRVRRITLPFWRSGFTLYLFISLIDPATPPRCSLPLSIILIPSPPLPFEPCLIISPSSNILSLPSLQVSFPLPANKLRTPLLNRILTYATLPIRPYTAKSYNPSFTIFFSPTSDTDWQCLLAICSTRPQIFWSERHIISDLHFRTTAEPS